MPLSEEDIREILRLIDESDLEELRIETDELSLYVKRGDVEPEVVEPPSEASDEERPGSVPERPASAEVVPIPAPMLGTFYRAEAPGAQPFVAVGTHVEHDTVVCLIEVMKMMNSVPAGVVGTIVEVCVENAELVEQGAPLFHVEPEQ
jgi:acetyl-CoA carboxylase biotin carboxyl carrier protein